VTAANNYAFIDGTNMYLSAKHLGWEIDWSRFLQLVHKPTLLLPNGDAKGNCDAELVLLQAVIEIGNYARAVIVTGDGDLGCLVSYLPNS
jgi:uncharacterized LabA/DUF88 family protein